MRCNGHSVAELAAILAMPFPPEHIDWKPQQAGYKGDKPWVKLIAFIDNRAIMDRLDEACGIAGWRNEFAPLASGAMMAGISIRYTHDDGTVEWITKWDGAPATEIESVKGAISGAMKRAGVQLGIGRYLYDVEVTFGQIAPENDWNAKQVKPKEGKPFRWYPPRLPAWAIPGGSGKPGVVSEEQRKRGELAAKALEKTPSRDEVLPGTKAHFHGHGGKRLRAVPTSELQRALEKFREVGTEEYSFIIECIGEVLADRAAGTDKQDAN